MTTLPTIPFGTHHSPHTPPDICIIGLGYIGLSTTAVLAEHGYRVHGVDVRSEIVETINRGDIHICEPGLGLVVNTVVHNGCLQASLTPVEADVFILCVPTPITKDHQPDLTYVEQAAKSIRPFVRQGNLVVLESTSPPGTTEQVVVKHAIPSSLAVGLDVFVAHCPERVLPGRILIEVVENDRIVGGITSACTAKAKQFFETFVKGKVWSTTAMAAEITKLVENASRDVNIAFANEISILAEHFNTDPLEIIDLANKHPRVNILQPGPGVGGHCISVDPWFLVHALPERTRLMRSAREVNGAKPYYIVDKVAALLANKPNAVIGCLGLTYKANVDDLRESPALTIVRELRQRNLGEVLVHDPFVSSEKFQEFPLSTCEEVLERSDLLLLLTDHAQFADLPTDLLSNKLVVDTRGFWRGKLTGSAAVLTVPKESSRRKAA